MKSGGGKKKGREKVGCHGKRGEEKGRNGIDVLPPSAEK